MSVTTVQPPKPPRRVIGAGGKLFVIVSLLAVAQIAVAATDPTPAQPPGHITGLGGIFVRSKDPKALSAWYRDVLGIPMEVWGGATLKYDAPGHPPVIAWSAFKQTTKYMDPSTREFMLNFAVDNMDAFIARLKSKGVTILKQDDSDPSGRFAWLLDPDGTKIELWQPKAAH
jgi:catechol 2,3-dioxygenase-like lactoylglutathione lyase family enzyme